MDLSPKDIDKAKFVFSIYDFEGRDKIDSFNLGDCLRAMDLTPSLKTIAKLGGTQKKGEKSLTIEEFLSVFAEAKKDKDVGCLADYIEVLKCHDKYNDGNMQATQLIHMLLASGERMDNEAIQTIINECCDTPDDDGNIKYLPFITKVCNGPISAFDALEFGNLASTTAPTSGPPARKMRPSITVDDIDAPSVSFAAAIPMNLSRKSSFSAADALDEAPEASFTLKTPRKSITPTDT